MYYISNRSPRDKEPESTFNFIGWPLWWPKFDRKAAAQGGFLDSYKIKSFLEKLSSGGRKELERTNLWVETSRILTKWRRERKSVLDQFRRLPAPARLLAAGGRCVRGRVAFGGGGELRFAVWCCGWSERWGVVVTGREKRRMGRGRRRSHVGEEKSGSTIF